MWADRRKRRGETRQKLLPHQTKSEAAETFSRSVEEAGRTTNADRLPEPGAATQHAKGPGAGARRILIRCSGIVFRIVPVTTPFPHIPAHVVQTKSRLCGLSPVANRVVAPARIAYSNCASVGSRCGVRSPLNRLPRRTFSWTTNVHKSTLLVRVRKILAGGKNSGIATKAPRR